MKKNILVNQTKLLKIIKLLLKTKPYIGIILLHEYFRNLYPNDPFIPFKIKDPLIRIIRIQKDLIDIGNRFSKLGAYKLNFKNEKKIEFKKKTGLIYYPFWNSFSKKENNKAKELIYDRFKNFKSININNFFKDKYIIDVGCGGGRYSNALMNFGAKKVIGIDYADKSIALAKKNYKRKNLIFKKQNVLNISFKSNEFDIVFSNGVIHHTNDLKKGIREAVRVCKKGGYIWLFLYGSGGIFWPARRQMNKFMKKIPQEYSQEVLNMIGMPSNRFIFMDNWYVPYEKHCSHKEVYKILNDLNVNKIESLTKGNLTDLTTGISKFKNGKFIWGEGHIRLLIKK